MMLQWFGNYAFAGAIIFLILGLVDYALVSQYIFPKLEAARRAGSGGSGTEVKTRDPVQAIRSVLLMTCFIIFPAVGYWVGPLVLPALGL